jgi:hypothetical protein
MCRRSTPNHPRYCVKMCLSISIYSFFSLLFRTGSPAQREKLLPPIVCDAPAALNRHLES